MILLSTFENWSQYWCSKDPKDLLQNLTNCASKSDGNFSLIDQFWKSCNVQIWIKLLMNLTISSSTFTFIAKATLIRKDSMMLWVNSTWWSKNLITYSVDVVWLFTVSFIIQSATSFTLSNHFSFVLSLRFFISKNKIASCCVIIKFWLWSVAIVTFMQSNNPYTTTTTYQYHYVVLIYVNVKLEKKRWS